MIKKTKTIAYLETDNPDELSKQDQELLKVSREVAHSAYAPYSGFHVGAATLLDDNTVVKGNNQENAAYPSGLCAERVAVFYASAIHPDRTIKAISVSAYTPGKVIDTPVSPCGSCLQVLIEYEKKQNSPIKVILSGEKGKIIVMSCVADLLPLSFTNDDLKR